MNKLCFITYQFKTGGVERVFTSIANNINYEITLFTITNNYDSIIRAIPNTVKVVPIHDSYWFKILWSLNRFIPILPYIIILISEIIYLRFNKRWKGYTFINFSDTASSLLVTYLGSSLKKRYSWIHSNPRTIIQSRFACIYKYIYTKTNKIICISHEQKEILINIIPKLKRENIIVIYNIIDHKYILQQKDEEIEFKDKFILMVARFDFRSKDFFTLIDAYHILPPHYKQSYKLLLIGDGPDLLKVKKYVNDKGEINQIQFIGKEDNPYKWINNAEIFILSSKSEGLPTVLLEALICGTPTISTMCETGPKEILDNGNCGILIPIGNPILLSEAIKELLTNESKRKLFINNGYIKAKEFYPKYIIPQIEKLWKV